MDYEAAFELIVAGVREGLAAIAAQDGVEFVDASTEEKAEGAPTFVFQLVPSSPAAAPVEVMPDNADSTYLSVGQGGWIEVFTTPKDPRRGIEDTLRIVEAIVAGRLREQVWRRKKTGEWVDSLLHIQMTPDDPWRLIGEVGRPLPVVRRWLYDEEAIEYEPYRS